MISGPNLDLSCILQSDVAPFCKSYAKFFFDAKVFGIEWRVVKVLVPFIYKSAFFGQYQILPQFSILGPGYSVI